MILREIAATSRSAFAALLGARASRSRNVAVLIFALALIPIWQRGFLPRTLTHAQRDAHIDKTYAVYASTGVHFEWKFFFFLYHLNLYPLATTAPILADTKAEAVRQLEQNGAALQVDVAGSLRAGDRGRAYLYYPWAWIEHDTVHPRLEWANTIGMCLALGALFAGFWWIGRTWMGAFLVIVLGSDPFQLYVNYRQNNVFGWSMIAALLLMAMHLPLMTSKPAKARWIWSVPVASGLLLASARTIRGEATMMALSAIMVYLTLSGAAWKRRLMLAGLFVVALVACTKGYTRLFVHKYDEAHAAMVAHGGTPYTGPLPIYHEVWHPIFCGLGDYDTKYGYEWDDRVAFKYAIPILRDRYNVEIPPWNPTHWQFDASYDGHGKYMKYVAELPHYNEVIRDKVVHDITNDPWWYLDILKKRVWRILTETPAVAVYFPRLMDEPVDARSGFLGLACVPLLLLLALARRWTLVKILLFTVPLSAPAFIIFSDKGMTNYSTYHYFGAAIMLALLFSGARQWLRRPADV